MSQESVPIGIRYCADICYNNDENSLNVYLWMRRFVKNRIK